MWKFLIYTCVLFVNVNCACEDDDCFKLYQSQLGDLKDSIKSTFDDLLRRYNVSEKTFRTLIDDLNHKFDDADRKWRNFVDNAELIKSQISVINGTAIKLIEELKEIDRGVDRLAFDNFGEVLKVSNSTVPVNISRSLIDSINDTLIKRNEFITLFETKMKSLTDLPHSTSEEIRLFDSLAQRNTNETCWDDYRRQLKDLFAKLAGLIDFKDVSSRLNGSIYDATDNLKRAQEILARSEAIDAEASDRQRTLEAAVETLRLAREVERLKDAIYEKKAEIERSSFDDGLQKLFEKYDTSRYLQLLDEIRDTSEKIAGVEVDEGEIDLYRERIDKAIRYIENCR